MGNVVRKDNGRKEKVDGGIGRVKIMFTLNKNKTSWFFKVFKLKANKV